MRKGKYVALLMLVTILVLSGCSFSGTGEYKTILNLDNLTQIEVQTAKTISGKNASKVIDGKSNTAYKFNNEKDSLELVLNTESEFDCIIAEEKGWNIRSFHIEIMKMEGDEEKWQTIYRQDSMEDLRICYFDKVVSKKIRLVVDKSDSPFSLAEVSVYRSNRIEKQMHVSGYVRINDMMTDEYKDKNSRYYLDPEYFSVVNQVLLMGGVRFNNDGTIKIDDMFQGGKYQEILQSLRNDVIMGRNVKIISTIFMSSDPMSVIKTNKEKTIKNILDMLIENNLDGVNFDWEFPKGKKQYDAFGEFLIDLKKTLSEHGMILSCAFYSWGIDLSVEALKSIDQIEIMGYDTFDRVGNNSGFLGTCVQPISYFIDKGVPPENINLGIPFFGRTADSENNWRDYDLYNLGKFDNYIDDLSESAPLYFNGPQMVEDKVAYSVLAGLGGVMIYYIREDKPFADDNSLVRAIGKSMDKFTTTGGAR